MARIPVTLVSWEYDDETKRIIATFAEASSANTADPVNFVPSKTFEVELSTRSVTEQTTS